MSGPAAATFGNANSAATSVGFTVAGMYVLQLTADDGLFVRSDTVSVTVTFASGNLPPIVDAGPDQTITLPARLSRERSMTTVAGHRRQPAVENQTPAIGTVTFGDAHDHDNGDFLGPEPTCCG